VTRWRPVIVICGLIESSARAVLTFLVTKPGRKRTEPDFRVLRLEVVAMFISRMNGTGGNRDSFVFISQTECKPLTSCLRNVKIVPWKNYVKFPFRRASRRAPLTTLQNSFASVLRCQIWTPLLSIMNYTHCSTEIRYLTINTVRSRQ
jgi:hypothetical protein